MAAGLRSGRGVVCLAFASAVIVALSSVETHARNMNGSAGAVEIGAGALSEAALQIDSTPPTVSIAAPSAGATVSGTATVSATASDNVGVAGVQFKVDGANLGAEVTASPYTVSWPTQGSTDLIVGVVKVAVGPMTISAGSGLTKRQGVSCPSCTGDDTVTVDKIQSTAGTAAATFTFSGPAHYFAHVAAFKAATTPAYLQGAGATTNVAGTSLAKAFAASTTAGSLVVAAVAWQGTAPLRVTDSQGNSYAVATTAYDATLGQSLAIVYAANVMAGATTVTAAFGSQSPTAKRLEILEYAGMATSNLLDGTATNIAEGTTTPDAVTTGAASTTAAAPIADGNHTLTAVARDGAGNTATSAAVPVTVLNDSTPPTVSISSPTTGATVTGTVTVTANASDNTGVAGVQFQLDGALLGPEDVAAPYAVAWNTRGSTDLVFGVVKVIVPMTISAGTGSTKRQSVSCPACPSEDTVSVDEIQSTAGSAAATFTFSVPAHYSAHLAAFKASTTPAYLQGAAATSNVAATSIAKAFDSPVAAGSLLVAAVAWQGSAPVTMTDSQGNTYAVATTAFDAALGQSLAILYAANAAGGSDTVTASFGTALPTIQRLEIHEYAGMAATNPLDATATNIGDATATADAATSGSTATTATAPAANGSHTLRATARDAAGNQTTSAAVTVTLTDDATPPVISALAAGSITPSSATISWTTNEASDSQVDFGPTTAYGSTSPVNGTLVTAHSVSLSGLTGNTVYHARARSRDGAGNLALSGDLTFTTADNTPPTVTITAPAAGATISGTATISATATDNVGVVGVQFKVDGAPLGSEDLSSPYTKSWSTQGSTDLVFGVVKVNVGPMTISAGSGLTKRQGVSCPGCSGDDTVSVDKIQSTAGTAAATFTLSGPAHYFAHVAAFKAATTPVYQQGAAATSNTAATTLAKAFSTPTTAGSLLVAAVAWTGTAPLTVTDSQGNSYGVATTAYDATLGQSVAIVYATNASAGAATVTASFGGQSPNARRLEIHEYTGMAATNPLDGTATNIGEGTTSPDAVTSGAASTTIIAPASEGNHTLTAFARDAAGNATTSAAVTVTVHNDVTPPTVSITAPASGSTVSGTVTIAASASDNFGVVGVEFRVDGVVIADDTASPYTVAWNTTAQSSGGHALTAVARDAAGNRTTSAVVTVTVANSTGQVTLAWDASPDPNVVGYKVYVGTSSGAYSVSVTDVGNVTGYTVGGLQSGTYYFAVTAYDLNDVESGFTNEVSAAVP